MKILVLGGNGFIGRNICKYLLEIGYDITSFDIQEPGLKLPGVRYILGDFFDDDEILPLLDGIDVVFHAISTINPGNSNVRYMQGYMYDFMQSVKLCNWSIEFGFKIIYLSSGGTVYGYQEKMPITEETLSVPINHYGNIKLCVENTIRTFNKQSGTNNIIARIANPYGPEQDYHNGVGFIDAALKHAIAQEIIEIWGDGYTIRDYIYIDDVCRMLASLIKYPGPEAIFNMSSNRGTTQKEVIQIIKQMVPNVRIKYLPARPVDVSQIVLDNQKIMKLVNAPCISIEDGIKKYYNYLLAQTSRSI